MKHNEWDGTLVLVEQLIGSLKDLRAEIESDADLADEARAVAISGMLERAEEEINSIVVVPRG
jgi:hypothetical protein